MRVFCRIIESGSFSGAADLLNLPRTTVSGQIQSLESLLGIRLLMRTTRRVTPTPEGLSYYERAKVIVDELDDLESSMITNHSAIRGRISIELPSAVGTLLVIPALTSFIDEYPNVFIDIGYSRWVGVDCAIRAGTVQDLDLVVKPVGSMRFVLCASPLYLKKRPKISAPEDLQEHRLLGYKSPDTDARAVQNLSSGEEVFVLDQPPYMYFNNSEAITVAALSGLGIALLPLAKAEPYLEANKLEKVLPGWKCESLTLNVVYPSLRDTSNRLRAFLAWMTKLFANDPLWRL